MENAETRIFLLNNRSSVLATIGIFCLKNNQFGEIISEKTFEDNRNLWKSTLNSSIEIAPGQDFREEYFKRNPQYPTDYWEFHELPLIPGQFYPRIHRPLLIYNSKMFFRTPHDEIESLREKINQTPDYLPADLSIALNAVTQLSSLIEALKSIARVVQPTEDNLNVYGNEIRSLLILACTEVESQLRGILNANRLTSLERPKTNDYFLLKEPLRLGDYKISFSLYPWLGELSPFDKWDRAQPTQTLQWYKAYNAVKHDNETNYSQATLESLLNAIAATAIVITAQYGLRIPFWNDLIGRFFEISNPAWNIEEHYFPPLEGEDWIERKLFGF